MLLLGVTPHISYDYYSPKPGATNHTSLATFSIPLSLRSTTQQISVCQPSPVPCPCPPCQLWEVSHHTSPQTLNSSQQHNYRNMTIIHPDPVLPTIPPLQHSPPHYLKISLQSMLATMCDVSVQFVISQTRGHSPCPPYQLYEVSQHTSTSW